MSEYGEIVKKEILKMNDYHIRAIVDEWIMMPNHIHLLIELTDDGGEHPLQNHYQLIKTLTTNPEKPSIPPT